MHQMKQYIDLFYLYFSQKIPAVITFITSLTILIPYALIKRISFLQEENINFIYSHFIVALIIEFSVILFACTIFKMSSKKKIDLKYFFIDNIYAFTPLVIANIILKIYGFIVLDSQFFIIGEKSSLYPVIFFLISKALFYLFTSYYIPIIIYSQKIKLSIKHFFDFISKKCLIVLKNILISVCFSAIYTFLLAFIFSNIEKVFYICGNFIYLHNSIELFLEILFQVSFHHFFILLLLQKNNENWFKNLH